MKILDAFSCEGGAGKGYMLAGHDVTGVDILPKFAKRYPGPFITADAIQYILDYGHLYDFIHASPPCQKYSIATSMGDRSKYSDLIGPTRDALELVGVPYVIENVVGAPLKDDALLLCGSMFNLTAIDTDGVRLRLERHRLFESTLDFKPGPEPHFHDPAIWVAGAYGGARTDKYDAKYVRKGGYVPPEKSVLEELLGINWMTKFGLYQSLPPAYTTWLGNQLTTLI